MVNLCFTTSWDGQEWEQQSSITNGFSHYGLQTAIFRGELYGVMVQTAGYNKMMFTTKYMYDTGFKQPWRSLDAKYKSQGRCSVTVLDDRFYLCYRGTNNKIYMLYTEDFDTWVDAGAVGPSDTASFVSPAIHAYGDKIYITHAGPDGTVYAGYCDRDGKLVGGWSKLAGLKTQSALAMAVFRSQLYSFHVGYNNGAFYYQVLSSSGSWPSPTKVDASAINSGLSAVAFKYNRLYVTYKGSVNEVRIRYFDGKSWTDSTYIKGAYMAYQTGLGTYLGKLFVSYGQGERKSSIDYRLSMPMNEKSAIEEPPVEEEWKTVWNRSEGDKSLVKKFFCL